MTKIFSCIAYLDNGEKATIEYESDFVSNRVGSINKVISCIYKGVDITPIFSSRIAEDWPHGIYQAIENNSKYQWENHVRIVKDLSDSINELS